MTPALVLNAQQITDGQICRADDSIVAGCLGWGLVAPGARTRAKNYRVIVQQIKPKHPPDCFRKFYADRSLFGGRAVNA
jgi:hypothetical protein